MEDQNIQAELEKYKQQAKDMKGGEWPDYVFEEGKKALFEATNMPPEINTPKTVFDEAVNAKNYLLNFYERNGYQAVKTRLGNPYIDFNVFPAKKAKIINGFTYHFNQLNFEDDKPIEFHYNLEPTTELFDQFNQRGHEYSFTTGKFDPADSRANINERTVYFIDKDPYQDRYLFTQQIMENGRTSGLRILSEGKDRETCAMIRKMLLQIQGNKFIIR